ncbi:hypothetical protein K0M31_001362, partial [Melipona bicolor]
VEALVGYQDCFRFLNGRLSGRVERSTTQGTSLKHQNIIPNVNSTCCTVAKSSFPRRIFERVLPTPSPCLNARSEKSLHFKSKGSGRGIRIENRLKP